jgi:hypothetical protein
MRRKLRTPRNRLAHPEKFPVVRVAKPVMQPAERAAYRLREAARTNARIATLQRRRLIGRVKRALPIVLGSVGVAGFLFGIAFLGGVL